MRRPDLLTFSKNLSSILLGLIPGFMVSLVSIENTYGQVVLPYVFTPSTTIQSSQVNADFTAVANEINTHENALNPHQTKLSDILSLNNSCGTFSINFNNNQALSMEVENLASDPSAGNKGRLFMNTTDGNLKYDNGTTIVTIAGSGVNNLSSVLNAGNSAGSHDIDVNERQLLHARVENLGSDPSAGNAGRLYFNTGTAALMLDNGSTLTTVGGSQGLSSVLGVSNSAGSTNINFNLNQAKSMVMDKLSADPGVNTTAQLYYNTSSNIPKFYNGTSWLQVGNTNTLAQTLALGTSVGSNPINFNNQQAQSMVLYNSNGSPGTGTGGLVWYDTGDLHIHHETSGSNHTLDDTDSAQTLTNKSISGSANTLTSIQDSSLSANVDLLNGAQTISAKKTFSAAPQISKIKTASGTTVGHTIPDGLADDTFTLNNAVQHLQGKTLDGVTMNGAADFSENQATHIRIENLSNTPLTGGNAGRIIYSSGDALLHYDDGTNWNTLQSTGSSVTGPVSSTNTAIARWNGVTGKAISNSLVTIDNSGNLLTTGTINGSNVTGSSVNTGDVSLAAFGSTPNANGASLSGQILNLQPASASQPGGVSTTTQSMAGAKTFTTSIASPTANINTSTSTGVMNVRSNGDGTGNGLFIQSNDLSNQAEINQRSTGLFFIVNGSNTLFQCMGALCGTGASSPSYRWDVEGSDSNTTLSTINTSATSAVGNNDSTTNNFSSLIFLNGSGKIGSAIQGVNTVNASSQSGRLVFNTANAGTLAEKMTVLANGNVGINSVTPVQKLDVVGQGNFTNLLDSALSAHGVVVTNSSNVMATVAPGVSGNVLASNGTDWVATAGALNPMTTLGDTIYGGASGAETRLAGDTSNNKVFLREQSSGGVAAAPSWNQIACADLSNSAASCSTDATNAANISSGALALARGGTHADLSATGGTHSFLKQASSGANVTVVQPVCADLSDSTASCSTDATNASNISSGTLANTRGGTGGSSSASTGLAKVSSGTWSYATLVNADVSSTAAIAASKIAFTSPTVQKFTSGTSQTYTTPAGVTYIRVVMVGGGGGGGPSGSTAGTAGTAGGNTTFGTTLLVANGGSGGTANQDAATTAGTASLGAGIGRATNGGEGQDGLTVAANSVIRPMGGQGGGSCLGGSGAGGGGNTAVVGGDAATNSGSGGGGASGPVSVTQSYAGAGGGSGGCVDALLFPTASQTYTYSVGGTGAAGIAGTSGANGGVGSAGIIVVYEFYN